MRGRKGSKAGDHALIREGEEKESKPVIMHQYRMSKLLQMEAVIYVDHRRAYWGVSEQSNQAEALIAHADHGKLSRLIDGYGCV